MSSQIVRQLSCLATDLSAKLDEVIAAVGGNAPIDYTALFNQVISELQDIDANTDGVEATLTAINGDTTAITTNTANTVTELQNVITELQDIDANTDNVEQLLTDILNALLAPDPEPTQALQLPDTCVTVDGADAQFATPVVLFNQITGAFTGKVWLDKAGDEIAGVVAETDPCDCDCVDCGNVMGCLRMEGFDYYALADYTAGQTTPFDVIVNGTTVTTLVLDYTVESDGTGKASWYAQLIAAVNANSNFTMSLVTDADEATNQRPVWQFDYSGPGNETLAITENADVRTLSADAAGVVTGVAEDGGNPFGTDPFSACP